MTCSKHSVNIYFNYVIVHFVIKKDVEDFNWHHTTSRDEQLVAEVGCDMYYLWWKRLKKNCFFVHNKIVHLIGKSTPAQHPLINFFFIDNRNSEHAYFYLTISCMLIATITILISHDRDLSLNVNSQINFKQWF